MSRLFLVAALIILLTSFSARLHSRNQIVQAELPRKSAPGAKIFGNSSSGQLAAADQDPPPLTIEEAQTLAKKNNTTLQIAREKLEQVKVIIDKAWVMVKPQWNAIGTYTHYNTGFGFPQFEINTTPPDPNICGGMPFCVDPSQQMTIQKQDTFGIISTLTQPLFLAQAFSTIGNAYNAYDLARINTENVEDFLLHSVAVAYYGALTTQKFLSIARQAVETRKEHLRVARAKFDVGDTPKIAVLRAEIDVIRAEQDVKRSENALALTKEVMRLLIGRDQDFSLVHPEPAQRPAEDMKVFIEQALAQRRDLAAARLGLTIADTLEDDAWYRFLPSLVLTGMYRIADVKGFSNSYTSWNIGVALSIPLFDGGLRYAYLDEARSKIREATIQITEKERAIRSEIRQLWLKMEMADANLEKARRSVELAKEQAQLAKASFEAGAATNLEVVDANTMVFAAEISEAQEELNLQLSIMRLWKAIRMFDPSGAGAEMSAPAGAAGDSGMGSSPAEAGQSASAGASGSSAAGGMPAGF